MYDSTFHLFKVIDNSFNVSMSAAMSMRNRLEYQEVQYDQHKLLTLKHTLVIWVWSVRTLQWFQMNVNWTEPNLKNHTSDYNIAASTFNLLVSLKS